MNPVRLILFLIPALLSCATPQEKVTFLAGAAAVDFTPDHPVALAGYGARKGALMTGIHDPVYAKALWLETPQTRVCLVTTDLIGMLSTIRRDVMAALPADLNLEGHLILTASHTHSGPGALVDGNRLLKATLGDFDAAHYARTINAIVGAIRGAALNRRPARFAIVSGDAPEFSRNRRDEAYPPGKAPTDPALLLLEVRDLQDRPMALLVNYTAHPTVLGPDNLEISADWPGALQRTIEEKLPGVVALYANGAEGDIAPRTPSVDGDWERTEAMGRAVAERALEIRSGIANFSDEVRLEYREREVELPKAKSRHVPTRSVLGVLRLNDAAFACVPGEMGVEIGLHLKEELRSRLGYRHAAVLGLANDHLGYFLTEKQYRKGGYEYMLHFYGPGMADFLTEHLLNLATECRN